MTLAAILIPLILSRDPGDVDRYEVQRAQGPAWVATAHYGGPDLSEKVPGPGPLDTLWVSQSSEPRTTDVFRARCISGPLAGEWSPVCLTGNAWPDTLAAAVTGTGAILAWTWTAPGGRLLFSLPAAARRDSTLRVLHQETVQRINAARIFSIYGYRAPIAGGSRDVGEP